MKNKVLVSLFVPAVADDTITTGFLGNVHVNGKTTHSSIFPLNHERKTFHAVFGKLQVRKHADVFVQNVEIHKSKL